MHMRCCLDVRLRSQYYQRQYCKIAENAKGPEIDKLTKTGLKFRHCFQISLSIFMTIFNQVQIQ